MHWLAQLTSWHDWVASFEMLLLFETVAAADHVTRVMLRLWQWLWCFLCMFLTSSSLFTKDTSFSSLMQHRQLYK